MRTGPNTGEMPMSRPVSGASQSRGFSGIGYALCGIMLGVVMTGPAVAAAVSLPPEFDGLWLSEKHDGVFRLRSCGETLCGSLVGMDYDGTEVPHDKSGRSECGLTMLTDFQRDPDTQGQWNGHILDPDSGKTYHAQISSPRSGVLKLRGYVGIPLFGETQTWTRYTGTIGQACKMPRGQ